MTELLRERQNMQSTLLRCQDKLWISVSLSRFWAIFGVMIVLFAFIGPFGTFDRLDLPMRFFYLATTMLGSWCIAIIIVTAAMVLLPQSVSNFVAVITEAALASFPNRALPAHHHLPVHSAAGNEWLSLSTGLCLADLAGLWGHRLLCVGFRLRR